MELLPPEFEIDRNATAGLRRGSGGECTARERKHRMADGSFERGGGRVLKKVGSIEQNFPLMEIRGAPILRGPPELSHEGEVARKELQVRGGKASSSLGGWRKGERGFQGAGNKNRVLLITSTESPGQKATSYGKMIEGCA